MASSQELLGSREGMSSGLYGSVGANRFYFIVTDSADDDPAAYVRDNVIPLGDPHPWDNTVVAIDYLRRKDDGMTPLQWYVEVRYGPPAVIPGAYWQMSLDTAILTEQADFADVVNAEGVVTDRNVPIGPRIYAPPDILDNGDETVPPTGTGNYRTRVPGTSQVLKLYRLGTEYDRRVIGIERERPVFQLSFETVTLTCTDKMKTVAASYTLNVNDDIWYGWPKWTVKFLGPQIAERRGTFADGTLSTDLAYMIRLPFLIDLRGHTPVKKYEIFRHVSGEETAIYPDGEPFNPLYTEYSWNAPTDFDGLLNMFAPSRSGGTR